MEKTASGSLRSTLNRLMFIALFGSILSALSACNQDSNTAHPNHHDSNTVIRGKLNVDRTIDSNSDLSEHGAEESIVLPSDQITSDGALINTELYELEDGSKESLANCTRLVK